MSTCAACRRPIVGDATDPTVCVVDASDGPLTLCAACFWGDARRLDWTTWKAPTPDDAVLAEVQP